MLSRKIRKCARIIILIRNPNELYTLFSFNVPLEHIVKYYLLIMMHVFVCTFSYLTFVYNK